MVWWADENRDEGLQYGEFLGKQKAVRNTMNDDTFDKFRRLLVETYLFPANYTHKFIGKNSENFKVSVTEFEGKFVGLIRTGEKKSASGNHLALTYDFLAGSADDIIELAKATHLVSDLLYIL